MKQFNITRQRRFLFGLILLSLLILIGLNFFNWLFLQSLKKEIRQSLRNQILHLGQVTTRLLNGSDFEDLRPGLENSARVRYYQQLLFDIKIENELENILVLDPEGKLLVDYRLDFQIGDRPLAFPLEREKFRSAAVGNSVEPLLTKYEDQYFLTAYIPIRNDFLETVAVLVIDAPIRFFSTLQRFERGSLVLGVAGGLLLILFSGIIFWALSRVLQLEHRVQEQERLVQLGQMAASVAHEIRNPLSIMKGAAQVLKKKYAAANDDMFNYIPEEIDRLNRLVESFLSFARQKPLKFERIDLPELLSQLLRQLEGPQVKTTLPEKLPEIYSDPDALKQILLNLLRNALEASGNSPVEVAVNMEGAGLTIAVRDHGPGIPEEVMKKIFEPFFTTKATGTGLGLAITRQLVAQLGGSITARNLPEGGAEFTIRLPVKHRG